MSRSRARLLLRLLLFVLLDVLLGIVLEFVAATRAADVVGLALVRYRDGALATADDALRRRIPRAGEGNALLGGADLVDLGESGAVGAFHLVAIEIAVSV